MTALLAALQFLTIFPALIKRDFTPQEMGCSVGWYPLVGLALGGLLLGVYTAASAFLPGAVGAALTLLAWIVLTRALHFDGFVDVCDALFGGYTVERRLEIMEDSRIGAFGLAGGALLLLVKYAALTSPGAAVPGLWLAPVLGRWAMSLALFAFPYARSQGLGRDLKQNVRLEQILLSSLLALAGCWVLGGIPGLTALGLSGLTVLLGGWFMTRYLPGLTGDCYGALCELTEVVVLLYNLPASVL